MTESDIDELFAATFNQLDESAPGNDVDLTLSAVLSILLCFWLE